MVSLVNVLNRDFVFWGTLLSSYCVIMYYNRVTLIIYLGAVIRLFVCVLIQVTLFPDATYAMVLMVTIVENTKVKTILSQQKSRVN